MSAPRQTDDRQGRVSSGLASLVSDSEGLEVRAIKFGYCRLQCYLKRLRSQGGVE